MSSDDTRFARAYVAVLNKDLPSPLAPESDEEKSKEERKLSRTKRMSRAVQE